MEKTIDPMIEVVNKKYEVIGYEKKSYVHRLGILHNAFSFFIFNKETKKILIQKRAVSKYHSGGLLSNSCCSHIHKGENLDDSLRRCVHDELGFYPKFKNFGNFGSNNPSFNKFVLERVHINIASKIIAKEITEE